MSASYCGQTAANRGETGLQSVLVSLMSTTFEIACINSRCGRV